MDDFKSLEVKEEKIDNEKEPEDADIRQKEEN